MNEEWIIFKRVGNSIYTGPVMWVYMKEINGLTYCASLENDFSELFWHLQPGQTPETITNHLVQNSFQVWGKRITSPELNSLDRIQNNFREGV